MWGCQAVEAEDISKELKRLSAENQALREDVERLGAVVAQVTANLSVAGAALMSPNP